MNAGLSMTTAEADEAYSRAVAAANEAHVKACRAADENFKQSIANALAEKARVYKLEEDSRNAFFDKYGCD